jgi:hypothetical protein
VADSLIKQLRRCEANCERLSAEIANWRAHDAEHHAEEARLYAALHDIAERCRVIAQGLRQGHHAAPRYRGPF